MHGQLIHNVVTYIGYVVQPHVQLTPWFAAESLQAPNSSITSMNVANVGNNTTTLTNLQLDQGAVAQVC